MRRSHGQKSLEPLLRRRRPEDVLAVEEPQPVQPVEMEHTGQAYLLHEFHEAITKGITPATTCQDNLNSLRMVFGAIASFEQQAPVAITRRRLG
ncbi:MAG: hypothetical protein HY332_10160 [Chloroflexi bacterium]|nr:hypothetical protein [Chloroflexota bacterium]